MCIGTVGEMQVYVSSASGSVVTMATALACVCVLYMFTLSGQMTCGIARSISYAFLPDHSRSFYVLIKASGFEYRNQSALRNCWKHTSV
jgi:hypothetical protein